MVTGISSFTNMSCCIIGARLGRQHPVTWNPAAQNPKPWSPEASDCILSDR